jgi:hypothetical protein
MGGSAQHLIIQQIIKNYVLSSQEIGYQKDERKNRMPKWRSFP